MQESGRKTEKGHTAGKYKYKQCIWEHFNVNLCDVWKGIRTITMTFTLRRSNANKASGPDKVSRQTWNYVLTNWQKVFCSFSSCPCSFPCLQHCSCAKKQTSPHEALQEDPPKAQPVVHLQREPFFSEEMHYGEVCPGPDDGRRIVTDPTHLGDTLFLPLPSGCRYGIIKTSTNRLRDSFCSTAVKEPPPPSCTKLHFMCFIQIIGNLYSMSAF